MRTITTIVPTAIVRATGLLKLLAIAAGGYTAREAMGGWINPDTGELIEEPVTEISVACEAGQALRLRRMVKEIVASAGEHTLYWQGLTGKVELIPLQIKKAA